MAAFLLLGAMRGLYFSSLTEMKYLSKELHLAEEIKDEFFNSFLKDANESKKHIDERVSTGNHEEVDGSFKLMVATSALCEGHILGA